MTFASKASTPNDVPWKFEAGTQAIVEAVGFARPSIISRPSAWTTSVITRCGSPATPSMRSASGSPTAHDLRSPGRLDPRRRAVSFLFDGIHAHDISQVLDEDGVCACRTSLRQTLDAPARRSGDQSRVRVRLQRRSGCRRARRSAGKGAEVLRDLGFC